MAVPRTLRRTRWRWRLGCGMACVLGLGLVWAAVLWQIARVTTCPECSAAHEIGRNAFRAAWFLHRSHWRAQGSGLQQCSARVFWLEPGALPSCTAALLFFAGVSTGTMRDGDVPAPRTVRV